MISVEVSTLMSANSLTSTSGTRLSTMQLSQVYTITRAAEAFSLTFRSTAQLSKLRQTPFLAATAFINDCSDFLDGSYRSSADIDGCVEDSTTTNGTQLAGYGISATGNIEEGLGELEMRLPQVKMMRLMHRRMCAWTNRQLTRRENCRCRCMLQEFMPSTLIFGRET